MRHVAGHKIRDGQEWLRPWWPSLRGLALPAVCPGCRGEPLADDTHALCSDCLKRLPRVHPPICPGCGGDNDGIFDLCENCLRTEDRPWESAVAVMRLEGFGRELIHRLKYRQEPELARPLGRLAADCWRQADSSTRPDFFAPMPLHWLRRLLRGYNQAAILAEVIGAETGIPVRHVLRRNRRTRAQARLDRDARQRNPVGAFSVPHKAICENRSIVLIDDVLTTGATLTAAAQALRRAGARQIGILILARD
jgi:ComF family protein